MNNSCNVHELIPFLPKIQIVHENKYFWELWFMNISRICLDACIFKNNLPIVHEHLSS